MINGPEVPPISGIKPDSIVIFLHGYGSNGYNLIDIAKFLAREMPNTQFLSPNAIEPFEYDMADGYQWFSLMDRTPEVIDRLASKAADKLNEFLDHIMVRFDLPASKVILFGFSQGSMMSLYTALRRDEAIAGVIGFSGRLIGASNLADEIKSKPTVALYHGDYDDVVPFACMNEAEVKLKELGVKVSSHKMPYAGHEITLEAIQDAKEKILSLLN
ncbi:MAG: dienelactone hydrolase family protein [Alphaproteobacteria bacterium]|nr:dienelactone hydrolase family protein [Alphaproteobacteria bacterium]OJV13500.1 MAG: hypothetical protein BGO27_04760 [Alphaproteobacteria bacterium 33-17]